MKAPAFMFYTGDFLSSPDVQLMEAHEVGAYCLLLFNSWQSDRPGYLSNDEDRIRRTARLSADQWATSRRLLLGKFPVAPEDPTWRYNPRLSTEASKQLQYRALKSRAGKASAQKRAGQATAVEEKPTGVQHLLRENATSTPLTQDVSTPVEMQSTPVAPEPNTRSKKGQQQGNLSSPLSILSSLRSKSGAATAASAPAPSQKVEVARPAKKVEVPTLADVQAYAATLPATDQPPGSADARTEAAAFCDHYESNGWRVSGKTPMVDWRAAFRNWMRRRPQFQPTGHPGSAQPAPARARTAPKPNDPTRWS